MTRECTFCTHDATMLRKGRPLCDSLECYQADLDVETLDSCPHNVKCSDAKKCLAFDDTGLPPGIGSELYADFAKMEWEGTKE